MFEIPELIGFLLTFSLEVKLVRLNSNDLSSYLLRLVDTFEPELDEDLFDEDFDEAITKEEDEDDDDLEDDE